MVCIAEEICCSVLHGWRLQNGEDHVFTCVSQFRRGMEGVNYQGPKWLLGSRQQKIFLSVLPYETRVENPTCRLTSTDVHVYFLFREVTAWLWTPESVVFAPPSPVQLFFRFSVICVCNLISSSCWAVVGQWVSICGRTIEAPFPPGGFMLI